MREKDDIKEREKKELGVKREGVRERKIRMNTTGLKTTLSFSSCFLL